jgi:hypothetical protein
MATGTQLEERWVVVALKAHVILHEREDPFGGAPWYDPISMPELFKPPNECELVSAHETNEEAQTALNAL